ncbi:MAG: hypothetical protein HKN79_02625 [Flavobacteriales bacterium]|nr:hypothetical protein [Flavobacteriales bacterium]
MKRFIACSVLLLMTVSLSLMAQDVIIMDGFTSNFSTCDGNLVDQGSTVSNYLNNQDITITICSDNGIDGLEIVFNEFSLEIGFDFLSIYDGPDDTAPQVAGSPFTGTTINTIISTGTCLTLNFFSDASFTDIGWDADVSCVPIGPAVDCLIDYSTFIDPPFEPGNSCSGGTDYSFCVTIEDWNGDSPLEFHGFDITLGPALDPATLVPVSSPASCSGTGTWGFYPTVTSTGTGLVTGPGFFFDADNDGDPGNNVGDACAGALPWTFCFDVATIGCEPDGSNDGLDASITINTYSDGESGSLSDPSCAPDELIVIDATLGCGPTCALPPTVSISASGGCPPSSPMLTFDMTGNSPFTIEYLCDGVPNSISTSDFSTSVAASPGAFYELVSISDATCIQVPASGSVTAPNPIVPSITMTADTGFCIGGSVDLIVEFIGTPPFDFSWTIDGNPAGSASSAATTFIINASTPGFYEIDSFSNSDCPIDPPYPSAQVTQYVPPTANVSPANDTICPGETTDISFFLFGSPPYQLTISQDGVDIDVINSPTPGLVTYTVSTGGIYTASEVRNLGCTGNVNGQTEVIALDQPTIEISGGGEVCQGANAEVIFTCTGIGPWQVDYMLNGIVQPTLTINASPFTLLTPVPGNYEPLSGIDAYCTALVSGLATVSISEPISSDIPSDLVICTGQSGELTITFSEDASSYEVGYTIDGVDQGTVSTTDNPFLLNVSVPGTYEITSLLIDGECIGDPQGTAEVTTTEAPTADLSGDITICEGTTGQLDLLLTGSGPWAIAYEIDGVAQPNDTLFVASGQWEVDQAGSYTIVSVSDMVCTGVANGTATVTEIPAPVAVLSGLDTVCTGTPVDLLVELQGSAPFDLTVTLNGALFQDFSTDDNSLTFTVTESGEYAVSFISDVNCSNTDVDTLVLENFPAPEILTSSDTTLCLLETITIGGSASGGFGGPFSYQWVQGADTLTADSIDVFVLGDQELTFIVDDGCGIDYLATVTVSAHPFPAFDTTNIDLGICGEGELILDSEIPLSLYGDSCVWTVNGQTYITCDSIAIPLTGEDTYDVGIYVETVQGCVIDTTIEGLIEVYGLPIAGFSYTPTEPTIAEDILTFQDLSSGAEQYMWFLDSLIFSDEATPVLDLPDRDVPHSYTVCMVVMNEFGCADTTCQDVQIDGEFIVHVPSAFTPDNDRVNDSWAPIITGAIEEEYSLKVYGRNGQVIWETTDINERWIGQGADDANYYSGDSVYQWQLEVRRVGSVEKRSYRGIVTLVR